MVISHESGAFGPYFEKVYFLNIQTKQPLYITHSKAPHLHLINRQHFFCFCKFDFFLSKTRVTLRIHLFPCKSILHNINIIHTIFMTLTVLAVYLLNRIHCGACPHNDFANSKKDLCNTLKCIFVTIRMRFRVLYTIGRILLQINKRVSPLWC